MRVTTKRIRVIEMTQQEADAFLRTVQRAVKGHESHYAEESLDDGSFLGVQVVPKHEPREINQIPHLKRDPRGMNSVPNMPHDD